MSEDAFEYIIPLPDRTLLEEAKNLIGFEERYKRLRADIDLLADPASIEAWGHRLYNGIVPIICGLVAGRYPLFIFEGDVGTGKTAFARCASSRFCQDSGKEGNLFALSTRVRGQGRVGEASTRINAAFDRVVSNLGRTKLGFLLIDEADSLVTSRGEEHSHLEDKVAVNTIIQKVDDLRRHGGRLVVFLSTNRVSVLDAAVLRRAAVIESFARPNEEQRRMLIEHDLSDLGLQERTLNDMLQRTGSQNDVTPGYTFSDIRTRLLPRILAAAYPNRKITDDDVLAALDAIPPSPVSK